MVTAQTYASLTSEIERALAELRELPITARDAFRLKSMQRQVMMRERQKMGMKEANARIL